MEKSLSIVVGNSKVILCAGLKAYYLNIYNYSDESSITKIPPMNYARFNHTMTLIEGCPAVNRWANGLAISQKWRYSKIING